MNNTQMNGVNAEALEGLPTPQAIGPQDRSVTIRTATVEIKALTVNGRQVTQALFKQLPVYPCVNYDVVKPIGNWWGRINFSAETSRRNRWNGKKIHASDWVIFELNGVLYRDSPISLYDFTSLLIGTIPLHQMNTTERSNYNFQEQKYAKLLKQFEALEQLFIAV